MKLFTVSLMVPLVLVSAVPVYTGSTGKLGMPVLHAGHTAKFGTAVIGQVGMPGYASPLGKYGGAFGTGLPFGAGYGGLGQMYGASKVAGAGYGLGGGLGLGGYSSLMSNGLVSYKAASLAQKMGGGLHQYGAFPTLGKQYGTIATAFPAGLGHGAGMYGPYIGGGALMKQPGLGFVGGLPTAYAANGVGLGGIGGLGGYGGLGYAGAAGIGGVAKQAMTPHGSFGILGKTVGLTPYGK